VWEVKVVAITESPNYEAVIADEFFSKQKSTKIDNRSRAKLEGPSAHIIALVMNPSGSLGNPSPGCFALSSLVSITQEQLEALGDEDLALITKKFKYFYNNRWNQMWGRNTASCFGYRDTNHFIEDCPKNKDKNDFFNHKGKCEYDCTKRKPNQRKMNKEVLKK